MEDTNAGNVLVGQPDDSTVIVTAADEFAARKYRQAAASYDPENRMYSAYLNDSGTAQTVT